MKAILTKRLPATNTKPARIKAYDSDGNSIVLSVHVFPLDDANEEGKHFHTASALASKMGWWAGRAGKCYTLHGGGIKGGYAWVFV